MGLPRDTPQNYHWRGGLREKGEVKSERDIDREKGRGRKRDMEGGREKKCQRFIVSTFTGACYQ